MDTQHALSLLGGLTPRQFMRRHWQKKPLLVRQAIAGFKPLLSLSELFALAEQEEVESRLIVQQANSRPVPKRKGQAASKSAWTLKSGPFSRRSLPSLKQPAWTLLVQGVNLHHPEAHDLLAQFRFLPDARLDDLMISMATPGGGVGPHFDSYDVFLLQASGSRRWRISAQKDLSLQAGMPLKILENFQAEQEFVLHAGDMLYLPPRYAHDGVAVEAGDGNTEPCMTYSIGFRAPSETELASGLLQRLAEVVADEAEGLIERRYRDPKQAATEEPARVPEALTHFARQALERSLKDPQWLACVLGEYLSEPKPSVWFEPDETPAQWEQGQSLRLHARSRMLYDEHHVFINGESFLARGADARLMRRLADQHVLSSRELMRASPQARELLAQWLADGWLTLHGSD